MRQKDFFRFIKTAFLIILGIAPPLFFGGWTLRGASLPLSELVGGLQNFDEQKRFWAFRQFLEQNDFPSVEGLLSHPDPLVRGNAVLLLAAIAEKNAQADSNQPLEEVIRSRFSNEPDWVTAQLMIQTVTEKGMRIGEMPEVVESWHPNQSRRITGILRRLIAKMRNDGDYPHLKRIIGWKSSYARNTWMIGHDIDFLKIFYEDIPSTRIAAYRAWLDGQFLRIGATVQPPVWNVGEGLKELHIPNGASSLFVPFFQPGKGFSLNYKTTNGAQKYEVRKNLFESWDSGALSPLEKRLVQRIQSMRPFDTMYDIQVLNLSAEECAAVPRLIKKKLISEIDRPETKLIHPDWMGKLGGTGALRNNFEKKSVAFVAGNESRNEFDFTYNVTTDGGDWGGFWWKISSARLGNALKFNFEVLDGEDREFEIELVRHEQLLEKMKVRLPEKIKSGEAEVSTKKFAGLKIDQINLIFRKKNSARKGRIRFSHFSIVAPSGESYLLQPKLGFPFKCYPSSATPKNS